MSRGPVWGAASEDLNATILVWPAGEGPAAHVNESSANGSLAASACTISRRPSAIASAFSSLATRIISGL